MRPAILRISLAAVLLASGVGVSQLPGSPLRIASAQPFSVEVYNGFKDKTLPWNLSAVRRPDGSIYKQGRMVMTVTKPDSSQVVFEQLTDLDGNLRGQLYGGVVDQTGTYTLKAQVAGGGEEHSKAFRIADSADPAANTTYTGDNTFTGTTTFTHAAAAPHPPTHRGGCEPRKRCTHSPRPSPATKHHGSTRRSSRCSPRSPTHPRSRRSAAAARRCATGCGCSRTSATSAR